MEGPPPPTYDDVVTGQWGENNATAAPSQSQTGSTNLNQSHTPQPTPEGSPCPPSNAYPPPQALSLIHI